jgi:hypothetical protein
VSVLALEVDLQLELQLPQPRQVVDIRLQLPRICVSDSKVPLPVSNALPLLAAKAISQSLLMGSWSAVSPHQLPHALTSKLKSVTVLRSLDTLKSAVPLQVPARCGHGAGVRVTVGVGVGVSVGVGVLVGVGVSVGVGVAVGVGVKVGVQIGVSVGVGVGAEGS